MVARKKERNATWLELYAQGWPVIKIAKSAGVSRQTVWNVIARETKSKRKEALDLVNGYPQSRLARIVNGGNI